MKLTPKDRIPHDPLGQIVPRGTIYLRAHEAAQYCRCGKKRLFRWERRGLLAPVVDPDGRRFYRAGDLDEVMVGGTKTVETRKVAHTGRSTLPQRPTAMATLPYTEPRTTAKSLLPTGRAKGGRRWRA
jgi:hypothetical protein